MNVQSLTVVFTAQEIRERVAALATQIDDLYGDAPLTVICVLKSACMFFADIVRNLRTSNVTVDFVRLSSYSMADTPRESILFSHDVEESLEGKHVLIIEDIIDTGQSMEFLMGHLATRNPLSLRLAVLIDKKERRQTAVKADFVGFVLQEGFIVGYGLDYAEQFRHLPDIYAVEPVEPNNRGTLCEKLTV